MTACPRCAGLVHRESDSQSRWRSCVSCGWRQELNPDGTVYEPPAKHHPDLPETSAGGGYDRKVSDMPMYATGCRFFARCEDCEFTECRYDAGHHDRRHREAAALRMVQGGK